MSPRIASFLSAVCVILSTTAHAADGESSRLGAARGTVRYRGRETIRPATAVPRDQNVCGKEQADRSLEIGPDGVLANAVVWLSGVKHKGALAPVSGALLDQRACVFEPRVQAVTTGTKVKLNNSDLVLHSVNALLDGGTTFNVAMPTKDFPLFTKPLQKQGIIQVRCEAGHDWMAAFIHVFDHLHFTVTGSDGRFEIPGIPEGDHTLAVWHERVKATLMVKVKIARGTPTTADVELR
jgi:plastocyanin